MNEMQLKKIINEEINNLLKEGFNSPTEALSEVESWLNSRRLRFSSVSTGMLDSNFEWDDMSTHPYACMIFYYNEVSNLLFKSNAETQTTGYACSPYIILCKTRSEATQLAQKYSNNPKSAIYPKSMKNPDEYSIIATAIVELFEARSGKFYLEDDYKILPVDLTTSNTDKVPYDVQCSDGTVLKSGSPYKVDEFYKWSDGSITYKISSGRRKAVILYDNKQEAIKDGWNV
jgi:hypothetical protein